MRSVLTSVASTNAESATRTLRNDLRAHALVVRGDELDSEVLTADAHRFYERYPDWKRFGVSGFLAPTEQEIDALCEDRLVRFSSVAVFAVGNLRDAGVEIVPTFRSPHVTLCHLSIEALLESLLGCEYSVMLNRHHIDEKGRTTWK